MSSNNNKNENKNWGLYTIDEMSISFVTVKIHFRNVICLFPRWKRPVDRRGSVLENYYSKGFFGTIGAGNIDRTLSFEHCHNGRPTKKRKETTDQNLFWSNRWSFGSYWLVLKPERSRKTRKEFILISLEDSLFDWTWVKCNLLIYIW